MDAHISFLTYLVDKGGPDVEDFYDLDAWIAEIAEQAKKGILSADDLKRLREVMGDAFTIETMQGFAFWKPHGYAGDYEIIDRIYTRYVSDKTNLSKWDLFWQEHAAAHAVRNRVDYLCRLLDKKQNAAKIVGGGGF